MSRLARNKRAHLLHGNGELVVRVSNITSAAGKASLVMDLAQDGLHLLSETKHTPAIAKQLAAEARYFSSSRQSSTEFILGAPVKGSCGVGLCAGPKVAGRCREVLPALDSEYYPWVAQGRMALFAVTVQGAKRDRSESGESTLYFLQVYGNVNSPQRCDLILGVAENWAVSLGNVPIFLTGDFNVDWESSSVLRRWTQASIFHDACLRCTLAWSGSRSHHGVWPSH